MQNINSQSDQTKILEISSFTDGGLSNSTQAGSTQYSVGDGAFDW